MHRSMSFLENVIMPLDQTVHRSQLFVRARSLFDPALFDDITVQLDFHYRVFFKIKSFRPDSN